MKLLDHWRNLLRDIHSPDSYIEWGFYSMINSALQRRVWTGANHAPIYPNMYTIFVGSPSVGKGIVINAVRDMLRYHIRGPRMTPEQIAALDESSRILMDEMNKQAIANLQKMTNPPLLIHCGPDATTLEAFTQELSVSTRTIKYKIVQPDGSPPKEGTYFHASTVFLLTELSNLFRKRAEEIAQYLQECYDCNKSFRYKTKHQGEDCLQNVCVNILAGCTPQFVQDCLNNNIVSQGFASRSFFIYEEEPRNRKYDWLEYDESQLESQELIRARILQLTHMFGKLEQTEECKRFATQYFEIDSITRSNANSKLDDYYGRIRFHMDKVAMAIHFADSDDMIMQVDSMKQSVSFLRQSEKRMHMALTFNGQNELWPIARKVLKFIDKTGPKTEGELLIHFAEDLNRERLIKVLLDLREMKFVKGPIITENGLSRTWKIKEKGEDSSENETKRELINGRDYTPLPKKTSAEKIGNLLDQYGQ